MCFETLTSPIVTCLKPLNCFFRYDLLLDQREEVILIGMLRSCAEGEYECERLRQRLCESPDFEPYSAFKSLQQRPLTSGVLTAKDVSLLRCDV